ncbi:16S rRNA (adenine(1518)-N(6)/adenine(1519)-N(6))-dimethyltransferase RsmA [Candidatus Kaiserbacteria bacterium]|nr:16S rRNA (adenine(1518)-N(6)/adenine(1519)-N(6))-dimethyltransferase RsmA [Candidatus Kaiserbacteria bacterium]
MKRSGARLGQHFLKHAWAARALAHAVGVQSGETILEIGPGRGILTRELLTLGPVVAIEKDEALVALLNETFSEEIAIGRLTIVPADIRDITPAKLGLKGYVLAANIPYYITGEIIRQFLESEPQPRAMALLIQKEVAQRITSKTESILSLSVKAYGTPKIAGKVPRSHFSPPPNVDSAILAVTDISKKFFETTREEDFFKVVRTGFASKRKFLANNLSVVFEKTTVTDALQKAGIAEKARAEDVPLEKWRGLVRVLTSQE